MLQHINRDKKGIFSKNIIPQGQKTKLFGESLHTLKNVKPKYQVLEASLFTANGEKH